LFSKYKELSAHFYANDTYFLSEIVIYVKTIDNNLLLLIGGKIPINPECGVTFCRPDKKE